jgi:membrane protein DedA with SNARE-associated domain/rhodanese-related sulfurtransferase
MTELIALIGEHGLAVVFVATLATRIGAPLPAAPLLVVAGGLAVSEQISLAAVLSIAIAANVLGDAVWFYAGRKHGARVMKLLCRFSLSQDSCVSRSAALVSRWGGSSLVAAKFVPGVSVVAAPMAGALGMSSPRFLFFGIVAGAIWSAAYLGLGLIFSDQIQEVLNAMSEAGGAAALAFVALIAAFIIWRWWRRRAFLRSIAISGIEANDLYRLLNTETAPIVIDVRSEPGLRVEPRRIPNALVIGLEEMQIRARELPRDREIVLYCNCPNDASAGSAALILLAQDFKMVRPLRGGLDAWIEAGYETVSLSD